MTSGRNIIIKAVSDETYLTVVVSAGLAANATSTAAVNGAVSTVVIDNKTAAEIKAETQETVLVANGSIAIWADDNQSLYVVAGAANMAISLTGSIGAAAGVAVVKASNQVSALVGAKAILTAYGRNGDGIYFYTGTLNGSDGTKKRSRIMTNQKGILIGAFNNNNLTAITASGSVSVGAAAAAASTTDSFQYKSTGEGEQRCTAESEKQGTCNTEFQRESHRHGLHGG